MFTWVVVDFRLKEGLSVDNETLMHMSDFVLIVLRFRLMLILKL